MHNAEGKIFQPYGAELLGPLIGSCQNGETLKLDVRALSPLLIPLKPLRDGTPIIAIDVSSIRLGETETGILCAIRGTIVSNKNRRYRYLRIGPFPFHLTEENKKEILIPLEQDSSTQPRALTLQETPGHLCNIIERWIQMGVSCSASGSVILWDGSLAAGTAGDPINVVSQILKTARENSNSVSSFAKATNIRFLGKRITDLVLRHKPPCLFEVEDLPLSISKTANLLGKIHVAKLSAGGYPFRVDIDRALDCEDRIMAVQRLLGNELIFQGYPETLRLAHIFSTFTANDVIGIQRFITQKYGLKVIMRPSIRKTLFGPFGTGYED